MSINSKFQSSLLLIIELLLGKKWLVDFKAGKTQLVFFDHSNNTGAIDMKMDGAVFEEKSFKILGLTFFSKLDWGSYIISVARTASKKFGALICSVKCLSSEAALYLYKSIIRPCAWNTVVMFELVLFLLFLREVHSLFWQIVWFFWHHSITSMSMSTVFSSCS